ncbi:CEQ_1a_G0051610.mRNA.1.CDS.1 [Saccharomyces cerevisiae]|nr:CEQ_1a_G0051610.mRNA.1.CDS.1 [Saccharomyces cerevisiae]CAI7450246.1 CEQ_1a_G0051610.mRNA.1.CDS.1 [Saccharomyces cerevisiae]
MLVPMHNSPTAANGRLSLTVASSGLRKGKKNRVYSIHSYIRSPVSSSEFSFSVRRQYKLTIRIKQKTHL